MNIKTVRLVIILAAIAFVGVVMSQVFWIRKGLLINQSNFENAVIVSLDQVAEQIEVQNWGIRKTVDPVVRISPRSYQVNISEKIDVNYLDAQLRNKLGNPFHAIDYTYEILNYADKQVVFADTVNITEEESAIDEEISILPVFNKGTYFFVVNFPHRPVASSIMISVWVIAILILMASIFFFGYSLNVIFRQARLSEFQSAFINNLAHEFKTPISTIAISAEVLNEEDILQEPARLKSYAEIIRNENDRLKKQVTKILQLAKLESDEILLNREKFRLDETIQLITSSFSVMVEEKGGKLQTTFHASNIMITADEVHFINVVNTLLDNALKYTSAKPFIELIIDSDDKHVYLSVKDNGIGIEKEQQKKIFDKFYRVPTGNVHDVKGFGLGLNYVKMISIAHGWEIQVHSELNKGSNFTLIIPNKKI